MASLLAPAPVEPRMSQLLPTVKCSDCGQPVSFADLGEHKCAPLPPVAALVPRSGSQPPPAAPTRPPPQPIPGVRSAPGLPPPSRQDPNDLLPPHLRARLAQQGPVSRAGSPSIRTPSMHAPSVRAPSIRAPSIRSPSPAMRSPPLESAPAPPAVRGLTPTLDGPYSGRMRSPTQPAPAPPAGLSLAPADGMAQGRMRSPSAASYRSFQSFQQPSTPDEPRAPEPEIETRSGGEAGMAGVGRRGFAAAARAAMMASSFAHSAAHAEPAYAAPAPRRAHVPPALDIPHEHARTPPLSPHSGSQSSYSPLSPPSPEPAPGTQQRKPAVVPTDAPFLPRSRDSGPRISDAALPPAPETPRMAFFEKLKAQAAATAVPVASATARMRALSDASDYSDSGGLAYARSSVESERPDSRVLFPSGAAGLSESPPSGAPSAPSSVAEPRAGSLATRSVSSGSAYTSRTANALRGLEPVPEGAEAARKAAGAPDTDGRRPPTRALTTPTSPSTRARPSVQRRPRERACVRCEKLVPDGRWIETDGPGVLCERCWKSMYLPKCRRCNLSIEGPAVSSADGQLKGKYHRECFNCHTCHKAFPDKSFYVFDGRPYCAYHYHEANDSLCASTMCGQPIEGPCAVSHAGDRYHPEHLRCEFELPGTDDGVRARRCDEVLVDYWEVEGRMLCERHARRAEQDADAADARAGQAPRTTRAQKRTTKLITLGALPGR